MAGGLFPVCAPALRVSSSKDPSSFCYGPGYLVNLVTWLSQVPGVNAVPRLERGGQHQCGMTEEWSGPARAHLPLCFSNCSADPGTGSVNARGASGKVSGCWRVKDTF